LKRHFLGWVGALLAGIYGLWVILGFTWLPGVLHKELPTQLTALTGHPVSLERVEFNPLGFSLHLYALALLDNSDQGAAQPEQPLLSLEKVRVNLQLFPLLMGRVTLAEVALTGVAAYPTRLSGGGYNFDSLLELAEPAEKDDTAAEEPWLQTVVVEQLWLRDSSIRYLDQAQEQSWAATAIDFQVSRFSTEYAADPAHYQLSLALPEKGRLTLDGELTLTPLLVDGKLQLTALSLADLLPLVLPEANFLLESAALTTDWQYRVQQPDQQSLQYRLQGNLSLNEVMLLAEPEVPLVNLPALTAEQVVIDSADQSVHIARLASPGATLQARRNAAGVIDFVQAVTPNSSQNSAVNATQNSVLNATQTSPSNAVATHTAVETESKTDIETSTAEVSQQTPAPVAAQDPTPAWTLAVADVALEHYQWRFDDWVDGNSVVTSGQVQQLRVSDLWSDFRKPLQLNTLLTLDSGGEANLTATVDGKTESLEATLSLAKVEVGGWLAYHKAASGFDQLTGTLSQEGSIALSWGSELDIDYQADVVIETLQAEQNNAANSFQIAKINLNTLRYQHQAFALSLAELLLTQPEITWVNPAVVADASTVEAEPPQPEEQDEQQNTKTKAETEARSLAFDVGHLAINNGNILFVDKTVEPEYQAAFSGLHGNVSALSNRSGQTLGTLNLEGLYNNYAPLYIASQQLRLSEPVAVDLALTLKQLDMTGLTPYSASFLGYAIDTGQLSLTMNYQLQGSQLQGDNRFLLDQFTFGDTVREDKVTTLPVKFATSLLKDADGKMDVDFAVKGDVADPSFRFGPLFWTAVRNLILKLTSAPFALLGELVPGGSDPESVDFEPGSAALDVEQRAALSRLVDALQQRPELRLQLRGSATVQDRVALQRQQLRTLFEARESCCTDLAEELFWQHEVVRGWLLDAAERVSGSAPDSVESAVALLSAKQPVTAEQLMALASARGESAKQFLLRQGGLGSSAILLARAQVPASLLRDLKKHGLKDVKDTATDAGAAESGQTLLLEFSTN